MKLIKLYHNMRNELNKIESNLKLEVEAEHPLLKKTAQHLLEAGGKRIRPVFVLLSGKFGDYDFEQLSKVAVTLELIHMASLVHDDVIDDADTRRGFPTVKAEWDNLTAMYTGDYILARSLIQITQIPNQKLHQVLANAIVRMVQGEIDQIKDLFNIQQNIHNYLRRIKRKTALLISVSCQTGALASNAKPEYVHALKMFGYNVGMAFQITDDILDFVATSKQLGKPAGSDLKQGNITLPVIYTLATEKGNKLRDIIINNQVEENLSQAIEIVKESGAISYAYQLSDKYLLKAHAALSCLPNSKEKKHMQEIANFIGNRNF